ncbi:MAG TPA: nicotinate phosphoribosyltransferase [Terriglobales bacterium]|nr:nicotinate phosphoribosyltransferase [Terriglobales bacterium]
MLLTDLYELTMAAAFYENNFNPTATFELFVRKLPKNRGYLVAAGLEQALQWVESVCCGAIDVEFLRKHPAFEHVSDEFFSFLRELRFTGDVWAVPEGTVIFGQEPLLRVTAPLIEAQILETYLLATITYQTTVATKASRVVQAAEGKDVIEFGTRRAHGPEAGVLAARASYIAGCIGTSNTEAGYRFGIPTFGTIAHSYVMALEDEEKAFKQYTSLFPQASILLVDTYDTLKAIDKIIEAGLRPSGVRIDSGDLALLSKQVRAKLDAAGLKQTKILASGDLDEFKIFELNQRGALIDGYGVGTAMVVSNDAPALGGIYKLVETELDGTKNYHAKFSDQKMTYPGAKQVWRFRDEAGKFTRDVIACAEERVEDGEPLLRQVMNAGKRTSVAAEALSDIRDRARTQLKQVPEDVRRFEAPAEYPVEFSRTLRNLLEQVRQRLA